MKYLSNNAFFRYKDIEETLLFAIPYIEENYKISSIKFEISYLSLPNDKYGELFQNAIFNNFSDLKFTDERIRRVAIQFENALIS